MTRTRATGHVAHFPAGTVVLSPRAARALAEHLQTTPESVNVDTRAVVADVIRMSRTSPVSRDGYQSFLEGAGESQLTTSQAAHRLGITPGAVRKRINRGLLPATFTGRHWLIDVEDVERSTADVLH